MAMIHNDFKYNNGKGFLLWYPLLYCDTHLARQVNTSMCTSVTNRGRMRNLIVVLTVFLRLLARNESRIERNETRLERNESREKRVSSREKQDASREKRDASRETMVTYI